MRTFEVAETDGVYYPAVAEIINGQIKVYSEQVKRPRYIRYGWQPFTRANLVNEAGLPASTFRAEAPESFVADLHLQRMEGFPKSEKGLKSGVSACYAGMLNGKLLLAGGCNFPGIPAGKGGKKKYYRGIYVAEMNPVTVFVWNKVGELPVSAAYGVSVSCSDGIICIGGTDGQDALTSVYKIRWDEKSEKNGKNKKKGKVVIETLPALPYALDNMCGTLIGEQLFIAGGNRNGKPSNSFLRLDLTNLSVGWHELPEYPGDARTQAVCAGQRRGDDYRFYLWGGFAPSTEGKPATLSTSGYCYSSVSRQWMPVATPKGSDGEVGSLGGGAAVALNDSLVLCTGGVNKDIFLAALRCPEKDYLLHPVEWYKFNDRILVYNINLDIWQEVARTSLVARAGAALVGWDKTYYNINGELKPGVRTPEIIKITVE